MGDRVAVLKRGELMQAGAPQRLYEHPDNLFVAGFIGSPAMNPGLVKLSGSSSRPVVELGGGQSLEVSDGAMREYPRLSEHVGDEVAVGVAAEHFVQSREAPNVATWGGRTVTLVEMLGSPGAPPKVGEHHRRVRRRHMPWRAEPASVFSRSTHRG